MSKRLAALLVILVVVFGMAGGVATQFLDEYQMKSTLAAFDDHFNNRVTGLSTTEVVRELPSLPTSPQDAPMLHKSIYHETSDILIESIDHRPRSSSDAKPFTKVEGKALGIDLPSRFSILTFHLPMAMGDGIASGDIDNDGWTDVLFGTSQGIFLYRNIGGRFAWHPIDLPEIDSLDVYIVALVDIDNDGWLDIYLTALEGKNYFILNDKQGFAEPTIIEVPNEGAFVTQAAAFGDIDRDGDLDIVHGNWYFDPNETAANKIVINHRRKFQEKVLEEFEGPTLTVLLSDFTNDGLLDLIIGNDFDEPDIFYGGEGRGEFRGISRNLIPKTTFLTMTADTADVNNDLLMDIYMGGTTSGFSIMGEQRQVESTCLEIADEKEKAHCEDYVRVAKILRGNREGVCKDFTDQEEIDECKIMNLLMMTRSQEERDVDLCAKIPEHYTKHRYICSVKPKSYPPPEDYSKTIPQIKNRNVLLLGTQEGVFKDVSHEMGTPMGFWTWNAKFADLDNDEWQDLFIVNGYWDEVLAFPNLFLHNNQGVNFSVEQESFGLESFMQTNAYTYLDLDNDGDLDIITLANNGHVTVYTNNDQAHHAITMEFRDKRGNTRGVGNKAIINETINTARIIINLFLMRTPLLDFLGLKHAL